MSKVDTKLSSLNNHMKAQKNIALGLLFGFILSIIIAYMFVTWFMNMGEINECNGWQNQSQHFPEFYLTQWQADQCKAHGIQIDAPIK